MRAASPTLRPVLVSALCLLAAGCTTTSSPAPPPPTRSQVEALVARGMLEEAARTSGQRLAHTEAALEPADYRQHLQLLRATGEQVAAQALQRWLQYGMTQPSIGHAACRERRDYTHRRGPLLRFPSGRVDFGDRLRAVRYQVGRDGALVEIEILSAESTRVAWRMIDALLRAPVVERRFRRYREDEYPVDHCYWDVAEVEIRDQPLGWTPRVRNNW